MSKKNYKIVLTGAESTGKTTLSKQLAEHYNTTWIPEFAREYIENMNRPYNYNDIVYIAQKQIKLVSEYEKKANKFLFIDTYLIITKIWFLWRFKKYPKWLDKYLSSGNIDLYLLCYNDLPWVPDPVRENPGKNRDKLYRDYLHEILFLKKRYEIIKGKGQERLLNAIQAIDLSIQVI